MTRLAIPTCGPVHGEVRPPGSKSITNRALVCAALAEGTSRLRGALDSQDTRVMCDCLVKLGIPLNAGSDNIMSVTGQGGRLLAGPLDLWVENSGTTVRFLTAVVSLGHGHYRLDGNARMQQRPIADLLASLGQLGVDCQSERKNGCPPVLVQASGLPGGRATIVGQLSSQYLSGLLLVAPYARTAVQLRLTSPLVSAPYVEMTRQVMAAFGAEVNSHEADCFQVAQGGYRAREFEIEPDASAASYFWGAAAVTGGRVTVPGLTRSSLQGDVAFCDALARMGCQVVESPKGLTVHGGPLVGIDLEMRDISDTVQTLAVVALFAEGPTTIRGVAHIRHKESDRIADLARELRKLGAAVEELPDGLRIQPGPLRGAVLSTYDDHRMAMGLSLAGLRTPGVVIEDPDCTVKTYPGYFYDLSQLCGFALHAEHT